MRHDRVQTVNRVLDELDVVALREEMTRVAAELEAVLAEAGVRFERIERVYELDMLYLGQTHTIAVPLPSAALSREMIRDAFEDAYRGRLWATIERASPCGS